MRRFETRLSLDVKNIRSLPGVAAAMARHAGAKVLFIGNSLTRRAIDAQTLIDAAAKAGRANPAVFFLTPDATNITNWDYAFRRYFAHSSPDEVFIGTGAGHLEDSHGDAGRLGAFYVAHADVSRALRDDLPSWEEKMQFLAARCSALHANRYRVKPLLFWRLIPHFFDMEQTANKLRHAAQHDREPPDPAFRHLDALLALLQSRQIRAHVVTLPVPTSYALPAPALGVIKDRGALLHDLSAQSWVDASAFDDGYHLSAAAARRFSAVLAQSAFDRSP